MDGLDCSKTIRQKRRLLEISIQKLAKFIGVSRSCVYFWEHRVNEPSSAQAIAKLEVALGFNDGELYEMLTRETREAAKQALKIIKEE